MELDQVQHASAPTAAPEAKEETKAPEAPKAAPVAEETSTEQDRTIASPAARKLAREKGINLSEISPVDPMGRVRVQDVSAHGSAPHLQKQHQHQQLVLLKKMMVVRLVKKCLVVVKQLQHVY